MALSKNIHFMNVFNNYTYHKNIWKEIKLHIFILIMIYNFVQPRLKF
jgi:hypothetical protein